MEAAGTATRVKGGKPGIPDTWTLAGATQDGTAPEAGQGGGQPGDHPAGSLDGAGEDGAAGEHGPDGTAGTAGSGQQDGDAEDGTSAAADPETEQPEPHDDAPAGGDREDAVPGEQDDEAMPDEAMPDSDDPKDPDDSDDPREEDAAPADADGEAGDAPDPALVTEITERIAQIKAAADAAAIVLTGGDLRAALAGLDEIYEQAAQARRSLKAAIGGRKTPAARPGGLRDKVLAHLDEHPGRRVHPARDPQGAQPQLRRDRQRPGHPGQARRGRTGHRQAAPVPPGRQAGRSRPRDGRRGQREQDSTELAGAA